MHGGGVAELQCDKVAEQVLVPVVEVPDGMGGFFRRGPKAEVLNFGADDDSLVVTNGMCTVTAIMLFNCFRALSA